MQKYSTETTNNNKMKLIQRLIISPIILLLLIFAYAMGCVKHFFNFVRYGGEWFSYSKDDPKRMDDIYRILKEQYDKQ